jgi:hypothetical protein
VVEETTESGEQFSKPNPSGDFETYGTPTADEDYELARMDPTTKEIPSGAINFERSHQTLHCVAVDPLEEYLPSEVVVIPIQPLKTPVRGIVEPGDRTESPNSDIVIKIEEPLTHYSYDWRCTDETDNVAC